MYSPPVCADGMDILYHDATFFGFSATGSAPHAPLLSEA
jgi:hypothetical protein